jgi:excisionase family DNA binding protein
LKLEPIALVFIAFVVIIRYTWPMMTLAPQPIPISREDAKHLRSLLAHSQANELELRAVTADGHSFTLPASVTKLLTQILEQTADGQAIATLSADAELTSQETADLLHVSRQHVVNEAEAGRLPFLKVGTHRRFRLDQVLEYQHGMIQTSLEARQALADQAQALGLDD